MEFFEKVNELAKAAADKTAEVVEDTRLKAQILNDEKRKVKIYAKSEYFPGFTFNLCCRIIMATVGKTEKRGA